MSFMTWSNVTLTRRRANVSNVRNRELSDAERLSQDPTFRLTGSDLAQHLTQVIRAAHPFRVPRFSCSPGRGGLTRQVN
jgi:hypothetical protein